MGIQIMGIQICRFEVPDSFFPEVQEVIHPIQRINFTTASKMESNSNNRSYQNYQGNVNSVMPAAPSADSNSNGTLNSTLHFRVAGGGTVLPSTHRLQGKKKRAHHVDASYPPHNIETITSQARILTFFTCVLTMSWYN